VTGGSWFITIPINVGWLGTWHFKGFPLSYWSDRYQGINFGYFIIDLIFWSLLLAIGWWVVRWLKKK